MPFNWGELVRNNPEPDSGGWEPFRYYLPPGAVAGPPRPGTPHPLDTPEMQNLANGALQMMQSDPITAAQSAPAAPASPPVFSMRGGMPGFNPSAIVNSNTVQGFLATGIPGGRSSPQERWTPPGPNTTMVPGGGPAIPPEEANRPPQPTSSSPRTGWWASRPEFNTGPSVLDIWNGVTGTGYDANMRSTAPSSSLPSIPYDRNVTNPNNMPIGTFGFPSQISGNPEVRQQMLSVTAPVGSPEFVQALVQAEAKALLADQQRATTPAQLAAQVAQGTILPGATAATPGTIANAATTAATAAAATPSAAQSSYVRQRTEILDDARREGLTPEQALARARFYGYGPVLPGGPELNGAPPPVTLNDMLSSAANALRPLDPRTGVPIQGRIDTFGSGNQQRFYDTITNLMQSIPDQEMTPAAVERVRQSVTPIAFQSWLDANPGWSVFGLSAANALHRAQRDRVRNLLSRPQIINNGLPR